MRCLDVDDTIAWLRKAPEGSTFDINTLKLHKLAFAANRLVPCLLDPDSSAANVKDRDEVTTTTF